MLHNIGSIAYDYPVNNETKLKNQTKYIEPFQVEIMIITMWQSDNEKTNKKKNTSECEGKSIRINFNIPILLLLFEKLYNKMVFGSWSIIFLALIRLKAYEFGKDRCKLKETVTTVRFMRLNRGLFEKLSTGQILINVFVFVFFLYMFDSETYIL